jgi:uncharacterized membrane protein
MIIPILILILVLLLGLGGGGAFWFLFRRRQPVKQTTTEATLAFHWSYIILPLVVLFLSIVLTAYFYHRLPAEVAYSFKLDGLPDKWVSRGMIILWMLLPQLLFTLLAAAITWGITRLGILSMQAEGIRIKPKRILFLMGNLVVLPQIIICFALADIFSYNSYQIHIMPLWIFALIIMGLGAIILSVFFISAIRRV